LFFTIKQPVKNENPSLATTSVQANVIGESNIRKLYLETYCQMHMLIHVLIVCLEKLFNVIRQFFQPTLLLLCIAGSIRNAGQSKTY
jgi:hypothetical protein